MRADHAVMGTRLGRTVSLSTLGAVVLHIAAFGVWPEYIPRVYKLVEENIPVLIQIPEFSVPPLPKEIRLPDVPIEADFGDDVDDVETIAPTSFDFTGLPPVAPPVVRQPEVFLPFDTFPVALHVEAPRYPDLARRAGLEGSVVVRVKIDEKGRVIRAEVVRSTCEAFDQAAVDAAYKSRFKPALQRDVPVPCLIAIPFEFMLRE